MSAADASVEADGYKAEDKSADTAGPRSVSSPRDNFALGRYKTPVNFSKPIFLDHKLLLTLRDHAHMQT